jgi:hypothetical protein
MKYIDSEKLLAEIERRKKQDTTMRERSILIDIETAIASLQQEQPSPPSNLDEAADTYSENILANGEDMFDAIADGFRAGAEWMAGQGYTREVEVKEDAGGYPYISCIELYDYDKDEPLFKPVDKVVVQIRKK